MRPQRRLAMLLSLALTAGACGISNQSSPVVINHASLPPVSSSTSIKRSPTSVPVTLYFVNANNLLIPVTHSSSYGGLTTSVQALLAGPNTQETEAGTTSAIPAGTKLLSIGFQGTVIELDFSSSLASVSGKEQVLAFAQIVATTTVSPGVTAAQIAIKGQSVNAPLPDGTLAEGPVNKADYAALIAPSTATGSRVTK